MNRAPRRFTVQQALLALQDINDAESGSDSGSDDNDSVQSSETRYQLNSDDSELELTAARMNTAIMTLCMIYQTQ